MTVIWAGDSSTVQEMSSVYWIRCSGGFEAIQSEEGNTEDKSWDDGNSLTGFWLHEAGILTV